MKKYTAIYSTEKLKNIQYSFEAENENKAIEYTKGKFIAFPNLALLENRNNDKSNIGKLIWLNGHYVK